MANYAVEYYTTGPDPLATVAKAIHDKLETIDATKTIYLVAINPVSRDRDLCIGVIVYAT